MATLAFGLLQSLPAQGDMYPDASNAVLPGARANLGVGRPVSVADHGAKADALTRGDGVMAAGSATLTSASAAFTSGDVGKKIQVDGAQGVGSAPLATTIVGVGSATQITLAASATAAVPRQYLGAALVATPRVAGNYVPGDVLTLQGGTSTAAAQVTVVNTKVTAATVAAAGVGGVDGNCAVLGTTGSGTRVKVAVTVAGGVASSVIGLMDPGHYFTNPATLSAEPVVNAPGYSCAPAGATLALTLGVETVYPSNRGNYSVVPTGQVATTAGSVSGATGASVYTDGLWNTTGGFVYGHDDSAALKAAIDEAQALFLAGKPAYVYLPAGTYLIDGTPTPVMRGGLGVRGEGSFKSNLVVGANYSGDLFSWIDAWAATSMGAIGSNLTQVSSFYSGPKAIGFSVFGNRSAAATQNALVFYDRNDQVEIDDVDVIHLNGRCLYSGILREVSEAYMRESRIGRLRCWMAGGPALPVIEFDSHGGGDGTNEVNFSEIDIYAPYGTGFLLTNHSSGASRGFRIGRMRIEGANSSSATAVDLMQIGSSTMTAPVSGVDLGQLTLLSPYPGKAALRVTAPNTTVMPYFIRVGSGEVGSGSPLGYGVVLEAGRNMQFQFSDIYSWNTNFTVGSLASDVLLDGYGRETGWTYSLFDPARLSRPVRATGHP